MAVDRTTPLFFDANCLFAAAHSPTGGIARIMGYCSKGLLLGWISAGVRLEANRAVHRKGSPDTRAAYEILLRETPLHDAPVPENLVDLYPDINPKDVHVYAAARACGAHYLITLDKRLAAEINALAGEPAALSPGAFLQQVFPTHPDYSAAPGAGERRGGGDAASA